jgi:PST family polysaccharide transporter
LKPAEIKGTAKPAETRNSVTTPETARAADDTVVLVPVSEETATDATVELEAVPATPAVRTGTAVVWSYVLTLGRFTTTALVTFVMAAYLSPRAYGVMALAMVWVTFAQSLALHGPVQAVIQRKEITDRHFDAAFWTTLGGSTVLAGIFAAAAPIWASLNGAPELTTVCLWLAPSIVLNALIVVPDAIMQRNLLFKRLSMRVLIGGLISGVVGVTAAVAGAGVWALVAQQITQTSVSAILVWVAVPWRPRRGPILQALRDIRSYSLHSVSGFFANFFATRSDALLMGTYFGPVAIGYYRFAIRLTSTVNDAATGGLSQLSLPHLSRYAADRKAFAEQLGRVMHGGSLIALPAFGILIPCSRDLLAFIGPQWAESRPALIVLCVAGTCIGVGTILGAAIQAAGRPGIIAAMGWTQAVITGTALVTIGIHYRHGAQTTQVFAIALAYMVLAILDLIASVIIAFRVILKQPAWPAVVPSLPALFASLVAIAAGFAVDRLSWVDSAAPFVGLVIIGLCSGVAAAAVLLAFDRDVRVRAVKILGRFRGRKNLELA